MSTTKPFSRESYSKIAVFGLLLAAVIASGCSSTSSRRANPTLAADLAMPAPGKAKVIFIRPGHMAYAVHFHIHDGERYIGRSSSSEYFVYECDPGKHVFSTSMDNIVALNADLLPDRIYYVRVRAVMGMWIAGVRMYALHPGCKGIDWNDLPKILPGLEKTTISSDDVADDAKNIEGYMVRLKKYQDEPPDKDAESILPEYGQTAPLALR